MLRFLSLILFIGMMQYAVAKPPMQPHEHIYNYNQNGQPNGETVRRLPSGY
jgi:hypothetical protein